MRKDNHRRPQIKQVGKIYAVEFSDCLPFFTISGVFRESCSNPESQKKLLVTFVPDEYI